MHVIVVRPGKARAEGLVKRLGRSARHIGQPVGNRQHLAHARLAQSRRRTQRVAVKGVELTFKPGVLGGFDQQGQIRAEVARDHRLSAAGFDLLGVGQEVFDPQHGVQLLPRHRDVGPLNRQLTPRLAQHRLPKAVVLTD